MAPIGDSSAYASLAHPTTTLITATTRTTTLSSEPLRSVSEPSQSPDDHLTDPGDSQLSIRLVGDKGQYHSLADWRRISNPSNLEEPLENQTFAVPIQTSFRLDDYTLYDQETEHTDHSIKQNQMLPIYCSIMGLIILSLLCYVVYKLWKQREAMTTAKLTEAYTSSGSCGKGELGSHRQLSDSASRFAQCSPTSNQSPQSFKTSDHTNSRRLHPHVNYETEPLLGNLNGTTNSNDMEVPSTPDQVCASPDLLKASLDIKQSNEPKTSKPNPEEQSPAHFDDLRQTVNLVHEICKQNRVTVSGLCLCLRKINRSDLIPLLQTILTEINPTNKPNELGPPTISPNQV